MKKKISLIFFLIFLLVFGTTCRAVIPYDEDYATKNYDAENYDVENYNVENYNYARSSDSEYNTYDTENIRDYDVEIHVNKDASMEVTEKITVYANGVNIKHGIYRDFPTEYDNKRVTLDVQEVFCDNTKASYTLEGVDRGIRIKIGDANTNVAEGLHTYSIKYKTERQMAFYEDYDELYWNIIGSGWNFEIEHCHAKIYFPKGTKFIDDKIKTYTGRYGTKDSTVNVNWGIWESQNAIEFDVNQSLSENEAFTVSICFEKGAIDEPTFETKVKWFLEDNCIPITIFVLLILLIIWQYFVWKKHGKDPEARVIIPKYYPPEGLEPADVKYIDKMGNTTNALEATILNLGVKGFLKFSQKDQKSYMVIEKTSKENAETELSQNELKVYNKLDDKETLKYSNSLQSKLASLRRYLSKQLGKSYDKKLFIRNDKYKVISAILSVIIVVVSLVVGNTINSYATGNSFIFMFIAIFISIFIIGLFAILRTSFRKISNKPKSVGKVFMLIFVVLFLIYPIIAMSTTVIATLLNNIFVTCSFIALILDNYLFCQLVRRYTEEGQVVKEDIEGFKMFINTAKDDDFADKTPEMFDKYFPYAYALGLQNKWAEKFENVLNETGYSPSWCSDTMMTHGTFNVVVFTNSFSSSFSSGMSSASTAPSSSGGSGGGGFSGGGGGGRWPEVAGNDYKKSRTLGMTLFMCKF